MKITDSKVKHNPSLLRSPTHLSLSLLLYDPTDPLSNICLDNTCKGTIASPAFPPQHGVISDAVDPVGKIPDNNNLVEKSPLNKHTQRTGWLKHS